MRVSLFCVCCLAIGVSTMIAEETASVQPQPLVETPAKSEPGLTLTLVSGEKSDCRKARLIALAVPEGQPLSPWIPAGPFTARWEGEIHSELRAEYLFHATVKGRFKLTVNGAVILDIIEDGTMKTAEKPTLLNKGANPVLAEFTSETPRENGVQLFWSSSEFPREPVPPTVFTHNSAALELRVKERVREGRLLVAQMRCVACHDATGMLPPKGEGLPELWQEAPQLGELGSRFHENWLAAWLEDPRSIRPHSFMPKIFQAENPESIAHLRDLAAYLVSQGERDESSPSDADVAPGGALFANLGCIACHETPGSLAPHSSDRIPLSHLKAKWQTKALVAYLKNPAERYPSTRMPNFRLSDEEATQLTAYLLSGQQRDFPVSSGDATQGAQWLISANCLNCHAKVPPSNTPSLTQTLTSGWMKGCVADTAETRGNAPDFAFTANERDALRAFAQSGFDSLKQDSPVEFAERQIANLRCQACHAEDGQLSNWSKLENEMAPLQAAAPLEEGEGKPVADVNLPLLTWAGEKLRPAWMKKMIAGEIPNDQKPRKWLVARMPGFGEDRGKRIAEGLSLEHGFEPGTDPETLIDANLAGIGEKIVSENGGLGCTICHNVGARSATAPFEAPAINLASAHERLRKTYFDRWMLHPLRVDPNTKMPRFADDQGHTLLIDYFDGDAARQFDAIWQYLSTQKP